ncbi:DUF4296 domain-containing protein [Flavobacterium psychrophilum]|jgi:hypothetical protein|uniref:DUF4296 domain-containing protein n=1 Tax=Flavobacterium psychrophilum TaxID=96345 RepID=UPI0004F5B437|nr:DUF4296 domain-containing protein [Flavobacterium psychrophilum]AIN73099.1 hypothetical protein FPG3_00910 [Flavobacterium psychrophilum FPG3]EKT2070279.1 DUF4296 domain-containing protein [Flavobacterium psychrophilum]EKT3964810.1 DUF4296 domain-containing protein [Flavobacterium psychrophilum]EKT3966472.1 DUF4296 domain-containing protein [Flavobacterium psychrophilum]EKT4518213.1 DUF4296 domain-containing protein [Flavobacterium psychrophilum]
MKKIILALSFLIIISACSNKNEIPKPAKPIDKDVMENILYDLALLQALKIYSPEKLTTNSIDSKTYIYQKYKIDSLQFVENNKYFASNTETYKLMFENVSNRLQKEKSELDTIISKELKIKTKKTQDSLKKIPHTTNNPR